MECKEIRVDVRTASIKESTEGQRQTRMKDIITARMNSLYSLQTGNQSLKNNMEKIV